jgi:phosphoesterase RecJ-like protein
MHNFLELKGRLQNPQKIVLLPHRRPDADALGSALALAAFLEKKGHEVAVISPDEYPDFLNWMHGHERVMVYETGDQAALKKQLIEADLIGCLDFSALSRLELLADIVRQSPADKFMIDHHPGKEDFAKYEFWDTQAAATAQLVYEFIAQMEALPLLDIPIAECIYAGIMTDTGSFKYPSTTAKVHRIVANLFDLGLQADKIHRKVYDTNTESRIKLLGFMLDKKLVVRREYQTAYLSISMAELESFQSKTGDTEGIVNYALSIQGIALAAMFVERKDMVTISFRSVGDFPANELANQHFNGGGHKNAAGGRLQLPLEEVISQFEAILPQYQAALLKSSRENH